MKRFPQFTFQLPSWIEGALPGADYVYKSIEEKMELAIELSRLNVKHGTGGPFGAAIFDMDTDRLIAPGVNIVVGSNWSIGHAEMVAFTIAQQILKVHNLGETNLPNHELVASTEPCAMCFGAVPWSGVRQLVCGARDGDARAIGFDEGPKLSNWKESLEIRGIKVIRDVLRNEAVAVLKDYLSSGGKIYNGRIES